MRAADDESGIHFRRKPRLGRRLAVLWSEADEPQGSARPGWTTNFGLAGAFIETTAPAAPGASLKLQLELPHPGPTLALGGEVRWVALADEEGGAGMGVHFHPLSQEALAGVLEYLGTLTETVDHDEAP